MSYQRLLASIAAFVLVVIILVLWGAAKSTSGS